MGNDTRYPIPWGRVPIPPPTESCSFGAGEVRVLVTGVRLQIRKIINNIRYIAFACLLSYVACGWAGEVAIRGALASPTIDGNKQVAINYEVPFLDVRDAATATVNLGSSVAHLNALDRSRVTLNDGSVSHLNASSSAVISIEGGELAFLNLSGQSKAYIRAMTINGGILSGARHLGQRRSADLHRTFHHSFVRNRSGFLRREVERQVAKREAVLFLGDRVQGAVKGWLRPVREATFHAPSICRS